MIKIERNDYKKVTEVREDVVQDIIDAFLSDCIFSTCHMTTDPNGRGYRCRNAYVLKRKGEKAYGFGSAPFSSDSESKTYHECEMREAFRILIDNGYHIFKVYSYGTWAGYKVLKQDFCDGGTEVFNFTERWE